MDAFQTLFNIYLTASTSTHPIIPAALILILTTISLHLILTNDLLSKKIALALGLVCTGMMAAEPDHHIARTSQFLFSLLTIQLALIALMLTVKRMLGLGASK